MYWRFWTPLVWCCTDVMTLVFWTGAARAASLNALGAVAGAGANAILGVFGAIFLDMYSFIKTAGEDGRMNVDGSDTEAVA